MGKKSLIAFFLVLLILVPVFAAVLRSPTSMFVSAAGLPSWSKYVGNPILSPGASETEAAFVSVFLVGSTYHMYYSYKTTSSDWMIGHATSPDKTTWTKDTAHNPIINTGECYCPIVWIEGSTWNMLYTASDGHREEYYATSTDGLSWAVQNNGHGVLVGTLGQWDYYQGYSDVEGWGLIKIGSTYYLWYDTLSNLPRKTGLATSTDLIHWTKDSNNPIFIDGPISTVESWSSCRQFPSCVVGFTTLVMLSVNMNGVSSRSESQALPEPGLIATPKLVLSAE